MGKHYEIERKYLIQYPDAALLASQPGAVKWEIEQVYLTTLAGYVHWQLTGEKVLGIGEASGMFPVDSTINDYDAEKIAIFDALIADKGYAWKLRDILPKVLMAGDAAGTLTEAGAKLLDVSGNLEPGAPLCPPEGDAGTVFHRSAVRSDRVIVL